MIYFLSNSFPSLEKASDKFLELIDPKSLSPSPTLAGIFKLVFEIVSANFCASLTNF